MTARAYCTAWHGWWVAKLKFTVSLLLLTIKICDIQNIQEKIENFKSLNIVIEDESDFILPNHEGLTANESARKNTEYFSSISNQFSPLNIDTLPGRVQTKLKNPEEQSRIPMLEDFQIYQKIMKANKPKSGVPEDIPKRIVKEFGPELCAPLGSIYRSILKSAKCGPANWPESWKSEIGIPLQKVPDPKDENDLRVISLTSFFSMVFEGISLDWLMAIVGSNIDPKQWGGSWKFNSSLPDRTPKFCVV